MDSIQVRTNQSIREASQAYQSGDFATAARMYTVAAAALAQAGDNLQAAEMLNNCSVANLKGENAREAFQVIEHTDETFAAAGDTRRQGMTLANQASALEALGRWKEAEQRFQQAAELLKLAGENELRSITLQSLSALQLRHRDQFQAMATMQSALNAKGKLGVKENILQRLLHLVFRLLNRS